MKVFTVAEFRANTRQALNAVDNGEEVAIERYGVIYALSIKGSDTKLTVRTDKEIEKSILNSDWRKAIDAFNGVKKEIIKKGLDGTLVETSSRQLTCKNGHPSKDGKSCNNIQCVYGG